MTQRITLAVNPSSGRGRGARVGAQVAEYLNAAGAQVSTVTGADAADLTRQLSAVVAADRPTSTGDPAPGVAPDPGPQHALVVVGGDGMVNLGVNAVAQTQLPLGIVPAGTGNDIARSLGLPCDDVPAAVAVLLEALRVGPRSVDLARCTGPGTDRWFAGVLGAGFDAVVNERANGWTWPRGRMRYNAAIARELPVFRPREYTLQLDGHTETVTAMLVAVGNGPSYGGGMRVVPHAELDDGLLDVMVLEPVSRLEFVRIFPRVYSGAHVDHPRVSLHRVREITVDAAGIVGYADGERFGRLPLTCRAVPAAVQLLTPAQAGTVGR